MENNNLPYKRRKKDLDNVALSNQIGNLKDGIEMMDVPDYRGVNYFGSYMEDGFRGTRPTEALDIIKSANANMVIFNQTNRMTAYTDNTFLGQDQPDSDLISLCAQATSKGLLIGIKPQFKVLDGTWAANLAPTVPATWFANYKTWILQCANLAQTVGAEVFSIGNEVRSMTVWDYRSYWVDIISSIRAVYTGKLTYSSTGFGYNDTDEMYTCCFMDLIDYAGLNFYPHLTGKNDPTVDELVDAWFNNRYGANWVYILENWQNSHGKPVILTEIGCTDILGANQDPSRVWFGTADIQEQANFINAMFKVLRKRCKWLKGIWWWALAKETTDNYTFEQEPSFTEFKNGYTSKYKGV